MTLEITGELVLSRQFNLRYVPKCEQAGAQKGWL